ncbi:MAG: peptidylprolyl isomerase [Desulfobacterales bacterium]|nr:peptidylprolyl isomerase [Desulfobacterales bacterium]
MGRVKQFVNRLVREPLMHFLLIGAGLFLLFGWRSGPVSLPAGQSGSQSAKIVVAQGNVNQMVETFTRTWQRPPTEEEVKGLIDNFVRDEIFYREAVAAGLDRDDGVIRRRLRQKMEFIFEDITAQTEPTDEELLAYMKKHADSYLVDPQIAFRHVYVNVVKRGKNAESDARQILAQLNAGADPDSVGDPFLLESEIKLSPLWDISKQFGESFSKNLLELKQGRWEGPVRSGYGIHLVFVKKRVGGRLPELKEVREALKRDWTYERQKELKDAAYAKIRERYTVTVEGPKATTTAAAAPSMKAVVR